jgi:hypothetical protein
MFKQATCHQQEWIACYSVLWALCIFHAGKFALATHEIIFMQAAGSWMVWGRAGPLQPIWLETRVADAAKKIGCNLRDFVHYVRRRIMFPLGAHPQSNIADDQPIWASFPRGWYRRMNMLNPSLSISTCALLLQGCTGGEN